MYVENNASSSGSGCLIWSGDTWVVIPKGKSNYTFGDRNFEVNCDHFENGYSFLTVVSTSVEEFETTHTSSSSVVDTKWDVEQHCKILNKEIARDIQKEVDEEARRVFRDTVALAKKEIDDIPSIEYNNGRYRMVDFHTLINALGKKEEPKSSKVDIKDVKKQLSEVQSDPDYNLATTTRGEPCALTASSHDWQVPKKKSWHEEIYGWSMDFFKEELKNMSVFAPYIPLQVSSEVLPEGPKKLCRDVSPVDFDKLGKPRRKMKYV